MFLSAYYFRAHMYTIVPRHVREDMEWMADVGTDAVVIGVLEQDLTAAVQNIEIVHREADRVGLKLLATPSRWGNLVAGCPKVPSLFCARNPDATMRNTDGSPLIGAFGPLASVHHPATFDFFRDSVEQMLAIAPFAGIVWDELKALDAMDYSPAARRAFLNSEVGDGGDIDDLHTHIDAFCDFFDRVNGEARRMSPDLRLSAFVYGNLTGYRAERPAQIGNLDEYGCDGRPYRGEDDGGNDSGATRAAKLLCDQGPYFVDLARRNGKRPLFLIENHAMAEGDVEIMDRRLPEVLSLGAEHVLYYYYPRSLKDPDRNMNTIRKHLSTLRG
jgi:hypothetical protein